MSIFCFHSVRDREQIPDRSNWTDDHYYKEYCENLCVSSIWFYEAVPLLMDYYKEELVITFDDGYRDSIIPALYCAERGVETHIFVSTAHLGLHIPNIPIPVMTLEEAIVVDRMTQINIGCHGHRHVNWMSLSKDEFILELQRSQKIMEMLTLRFDKFSLAAPYGKLNLDHVEKSREFGFSSVYGTHESGFGVQRYLANEKGYRNHTGEHSWPWKD